MNPQFKKGVLQLVVLKTILDKDLYGYELVKKINEVVDVNEGAVYPVLKRLSNDRLSETYLKESEVGPPRKYYHITELGKQTYEELLAEWSDFSHTVNAYLEGDQV